MTGFMDMAPWLHSWQFSPPVPLQVDDHTGFTVVVYAVQPMRNVWYGCYVVLGVMYVVEIRVERWRAREADFRPCQRNVSTQTEVEREDCSASQRSMASTCWR